MALYCGTVTGDSAVKIKFSLNIIIGCLPGSMKVHESQKWDLLVVKDKVCVVTLMGAMPMVYGWWL